MKAFVPAKLLNQDGQVLSTGTASIAYPQLAASFRPDKQPIQKADADHVLPRAAILKLDEAETLYQISKGSICTAPHFQGEQHYEFGLEPYSPD